MDQAQNTLVEAAPAALVERSEELALLAHLADQTAAKALSKRTRQAYDADWAAFEGWCARYGLSALPAEPETLRLYLTDLSLQVVEDGGFRYSPASLERFVAAVARRHREIGQSGISKDPRVSEVMSGIRRERGTKQRRVRPLMRADVVRLNEAMEADRWPSGVSAARDSFALLLTFATALRRSEVSALDVGHLALEPDGLIIALGVTKGDQEGQGIRIGVPYGTTPQTCVPCAYVRWARVVAAGQARADRMAVVLAVAEDHVCRGPLPRLAPGTPLLRQVNKSGDVLDGRISAGGLNEMLKRRLAAAGYDPRHYGFHSLRAGFVTEARRAGADARSVRLQTRQKSDAMVDVYDREYLPLNEHNAVWKLGL